MSCAARKENKSQALIAKPCSWSVRNSALLLFAHLATRMFGKGLNHPGTVFDKRIGIVEWDSRYSLLLPAFVKLLSEATVGASAASGFR